MAAGPCANLAKEIFGAVAGPLFVEGLGSVDIEHVHVVEIAEELLKRLERFQPALTRQDPGSQRFNQVANTLGANARQVDCLLIPGARDGGERGFELGGMVAK